MFSFSSSLHPFTSAVFPPTETLFNPIKCKQREKQTDQCALYTKNEISNNLKLYIHKKKKKEKKKQEGKKWGLNG